MTLHCLGFDPPLIHRGDPHNGPGHLGWPPPKGNKRWPHWCKWGNNNGQHVQISFYHGPAASFSCNDCHFQCFWSQIRKLDCYPWCKCDQNNGDVWWCWPRPFLTTGFTNKPQTSLGHAASQCDDVPFVLFYWSQFQCFGFEFCIGGKNNLVLVWMCKDQEDDNLSLFGCIVMIVLGFTVFRRDELETSHIWEARLLGQRKDLRTRAESKAWRVRWEDIDIASVITGSGPAPMCPIVGHQVTHTQTRTHASSSN